MNVKSYKVNNWWGINCITRDSGSMRVEVVMLQVPWQEVVDFTDNITDKNVANNTFKSYVEKYRSLI